MNMNLINSEVVWKLIGHEAIIKPQLFLHIFRLIKMLNDKKVLLQTYQ